MTKTKCSINQTVSFNRNFGLAVAADEGVSLRAFMGIDI